jgi:2-octaprenyl-6-methoxyphenol hydroxylase
MLDFPSDPGSRGLQPNRLSAADVIVAGAGAVGLVLGLALAEAGFSVVVVGRIDLRPAGRTVALLEGSVALLARLGLWAQCEARAAPLRIMRLVDDTGSLFRGPPVDFRAEELGKTSFGQNIENVHLLADLAARAAETPGLRLVQDHLASFDFSGAQRVVARDEAGRRFEAPLLVAADGRASPARQAARIAVRRWRYPQAALTAILHHSQPHRDISTEFHTRSGPFTLVPLPGLAPAVHRSSLVWVMAPDDLRRRLDLARPSLAHAIEKQSRFLLGAIEIQEPVGSFPLSGLASTRMVGARIALAGEAAHAIPPIGAQGLNLGLRDVASLAELLAQARRRGEDIGSPAVLDRYARARRGDIALRTLGVDWLNRALLADWLPVDALRGAGLLALGSIGPLRRFVMRQGLMPQAPDVSRLTLPRF